MRLVGPEREQVQKRRARLLASFKKRALFMPALVREGSPDMPPLVSCSTFQRPTRPLASSPTFTFGLMAWSYAAIGAGDQSRFYDELRAAAERGAVAAGDESGAAVLGGRHAGHDAARGGGRARCICGNFQLRLAGASVARRARGLDRPPAQGRPPAREQVAGRYDGRAGRGLGEPHRRAAEVLSKDGRSSDASLSWNGARLRPG